MVRFASVVGVFIWLVVSAGCSGCNDPVGPAADMALPDAGLDRTVADSPASDLPLDTTRDLGADTYPDITCGGSRTLTPAPIQRDGGRPCGKGCQQVSFGAEASVVFEAKGDLLVYSGIGKSGNDRRVYMVDVKGNREWLVQSRPHWRPGCFSVTTDGARLAYSCIIWPNSNSWEFFTIPLQVYDPKTNIERDVQCNRVTKTGGYRADDIALGTSGIALTMALPTHAQGQIDTFFYRFSDKSLTNLSQKYGGAYNPHMSGTRVVWTEVRNNTTQVVVHDTVTHKTWMPDPTGKPQFFPHIEGDKVVWVDHRNAPGDMWKQRNSDIYVHDLTTGVTRAVTTHPAMQSFPDVWGDWVVWEDWRANPNPTPGGTGQTVECDIYGRDMTTNKEVRITSIKGMEIRPVVDNKRVFFVALAGGKQVNHFMVELDKLAQ